MGSSEELHLPPDWSNALQRICKEGRRRIAVLGRTDVGKSSFIRALLPALPDAVLIDLDPGQKMIGPPGTVSLGRNGALERFLFLGTTSSASIRLIADGARQLAGAPAYIANTSGLVLGLGVPLQTATLSALRPDMIVAIGEGLEPILAAHGRVRCIRFRPSPEARRKSPSVRAAIRQAAFNEALAGAATQVFPREAVAFEPAPPVPFGELRRPVCALRGREDLAIGVVEHADEELVRIFAPAVAERVREIRLGRMWAAPDGAGWRLLNPLSPAWAR